MNNRFMSAMPSLDVSDPMIFMSEHVLQYLNL